MSAVLGALAVGFLASVSAASPIPYLRSTTVHRGHVVAVFGLGELAPGKLVVAVRPVTRPNGAFRTENVRLKESIAGAALVPNGYRWRSRHALRPGRYYVQVSGVVVLDCTPPKPCPTRWSNTRRVIVLRPR